jgi:hypothetical protein
MWLYRPDTIQCLTRISVSASKTQLWEDGCYRPDDVWSRLEDVLYKARRAYKVQPSGWQSSWSGWSSFIYGNCVHQFNRPAISLHGPDAPKPYYGNSVQPKCNRLDARATSSGRGLVMEAFGAILERRLQLTVRTLGQAVRTPSGILDITFYSNIGLGQNRRRWKADKKFCQLTIWMATRSVRTDGKICPSGRPCRKFQNYILDKKNLARPDGPGSRPDARVSDSVLDAFLGFLNL